jgi:hypothetical protein
MPYPKWPVFKRSDLAGFGGSLTRKRPMTRLQSDSCLPSRVASRSRELPRRYGRVKAKPPSAVRSAQP